MKKGRLKAFQTAFSAKYSEIKKMDTKTRNLKPCVGCVARATHAV